MVARGRVRLLLYGDAPQLTWLTAERASCWVHEARYLVLSRRLARR